MWRRALVLAALMAAQAPAQAAVAICAEMLAGETIEAPVEIEARRLALQSWTERAAKIGIEFTRWQLAWNRRLSCELMSGGHRCVARGRPCRFSQLPPPAGTPILKPGARDECLSGRQSGWAVVLKRQLQRTFA